MYRQASYRWLLRRVACLCSVFTAVVSARRQGQSLVEHLSVDGSVDADLSTLSGKSSHEAVQREVRKIFQQAKRFPELSGSSLLQAEDGELFDDMHSDASRDVMVEHPRTLLPGAAVCWGNSSAEVTLLTLAVGLSNDYLKLLRQNRLSYAAKHKLECCTPATS
eukprot:TRINITY_DN27627_c0_g2_i1.p1 TRINITY_DN27627_c0_g2~~TRINITY_DN27627_c0_g2_i1.p1  ORF type:complete len:164 (-),score=10.60 TRINITY_DN27627_c0_g2_i1:579-1070(-)